MKPFVILTAALALVAVVPAQASEALAKQHACVACHVIKGPKIVTPTGKFNIHNTVHDVY